MPGVKYDYITFKWQAHLGQKLLGEFKTKEEAMECYDKKAKEVFAFPILNNKDEVSSIKPTEETRTEPSST